MFRVILVVSAFLVAIGCESEPSTAIDDVLLVGSCRVVCRCECEFGDCLTELIGGLDYELSDCELIARAREDEADSLDSYCDCDFEIVDPTKF